MATNKGPTCQTKNACLKRYQILAETMAPLLSFCWPLSSAVPTVNAGVFVWVFYACVIFIGFVISILPDTGTPGHVCDRYFPGMSFTLVCT